MSILCLNNFYFIKCKLLTRSLSHLLSFPLLHKSRAKEMAQQVRALAALGSIHIKWLTVTVTQGAHTYMQAFTCEIKIKNKSFLKECKLHQIVC